MPIYDSDIKHIELFSALEPDQLERVLRGVRQVHLEEGQLLFQFGDPARRFFYIRSGAIKLFRLSPDGAEKVIDIAMPRQSFAAAVMFMEDQVYPVSAQALSETTLYAVDNAIFMGVLRESMDTCMRTMAHLSRRLHHCIREINNLSLQNAIHRLATYLIEELPASAVGHGDVVLSMPKSVLASRLSIQAETFSRLLHTLTKSGIIRVEGKTIHVLDVERLRKI
ncbi:CRP/FNR family transcriptional regulator, dissimilatory nitrate respiration regulator [Gammaproteobacteria bacterium]